MRSIALFFFFVVLSSPRVVRSEDVEGDYRPELILRSRAMGLSTDRVWLLLGHYRPTIVGEWRSEVDGRGFFLAAEGKNDPEAELEATLSAFFDSHPEDPHVQHPQCRFPARYVWLRNKLNFDPTRLEEVPCPRLDEWRRAMNAGSVTLVFASAFLNNPASMYGHTFLRLNRAPLNPDGTQRTTLLDYTINFAAEAGPMNIIPYAIRGLFGGFKGYFSTFPYYLKIQEYNDLQSRDLWEYDLTLAPDAVDRLLLHAWEMGSTHFDYFFFRENCSYQLLPLLEVADPSMRLSERFILYTIPADTVRAVLRHPGLVARREVRLSPSARMIAKRSLLTPEEVRLAESLAEDPPITACAEIEHIPPERRALILESAYDLLTYREGFDPARDEKSKARERALLLCRSSIHADVQPGPIRAEVSAPEEGHETAMVSTAFGVNRATPFAEFTIRPALHDLVADSTGYVPYSHLEILQPKMRYEGDGKRLFLESFDLIRILSLTPLDRWIRKVSWKLGFGWSLAREQGCTSWNCGFLGLNGGAGGAIRAPFPGRPLLYVLPEIDLGVGPPFRGLYRAGGGGSVGVRVDPLRRWRILFEAGYLDYVVGDTRSGLVLRIHQGFNISKNLEMRLVVERRNRHREASLGSRLYF